MSDKRTGKKKKKISPVVTQGPVESGQATPGKIHRRQEKLPRTNG